MFWIGPSLHPASTRVSCNGQNRRLQDRIYSDVHGTRWDAPDSSGKGGTTTNGNIARDLLQNEVNREIVISELLAHSQEKMHFFCQSLSIILGVMSSKKKVNIEEYKTFCTELYLFLPKKFPRIRNCHIRGPWISITPTLHKVFAHSWELNDGEGLGCLDERV